MTMINIAKDFSRTPGGRHIKDGKYSGEEFRKKLLEPLFADRTERTKIVVILDGVEGYPTSFLEEAFGQLARIVGKEVGLVRFEFVSEEEPLLKEEITQYIETSDEE